LKNESYLSAAPILIAFFGGLFLGSDGNGIKIIRMAENVMALA
jgi:hypothetical protein